MREKTKGILSTIAGFLWWFVLGYIGVWGNIVQYVTSYFRLYDESITLEITFMLLALQFGLAGIVGYPATVLALKLGPRISMCISGCLWLLGLILSSYMTNFWAFLAIYGLCYGVGFALSLTIVLVAPWGYLPEHKGKVTGCIGCGSMLSYSSWALITRLQVNPENFDPDVRIQSGQVTDYYFSEDIARQVPVMFRWDAVILAIVATIAIILAQPIKKSAQNSKSEIKMSLWDILKEKTFYVLLSAGFFAFIPRSYLQSVYKMYGNTRGIDDSFLSYVGFMGPITAGLTRILWSSLVDVMGFKRIALIVYSIVTILFASLHFISDYKILYMIWVVLIWSCLGATQPIFGTVCAQIWGPTSGGKVFSLLFGIMGLAGILIGILQGILISKIGYFSMLMIIMGVSALSVLIILFFFKTNKYEPYQEVEVNDQSELEKPLLKEE